MNPLIIDLFALLLLVKSLSIDTAGFQNVEFLPGKVDGILRHAAPQTPSCLSPVKGHCKVQIPETYVFSPKTMDPTSNAISSEKHNNANAKLEESKCQETVHSSTFGLMAPGLRPYKIPIQAIVVPKMSEQQKEIIQAVSAGSNVVVDAVAGSGKTTTVLHLVNANPRRRVLLLTYNARLKVETRKRVETCKSIEVHSYHAFGYKYYSHRCGKDSGLRMVIQQDLESLFPIPQYDLVILDEAQDITDLLFEFVHKFLRDYGKKYSGSQPQLVLLGDENQAIFAYKGADARYLTMANELLHNGRRWQELPLSTSYRVTGNMATFVNEAMLGRRHILSHKPAGEPVQYIVGSPYAAARQVASEISDLLRSGAARPDDIFILAPSIKSQHPTPVKTLENLLCSMGHLVHLPLGDDGDFSHRDELVSGKIVFATFHQTKGLERRVVIAFAFSRDYFRFYDRHTDPSRCPPALYVAATRATARLIIVAEELPGNHLPFLRRAAVTRLAAGSSPAVVIRYVGVAPWNESLIPDDPAAGGGFAGGGGGGRVPAGRAAAEGGADSTLIQVKGWLRQQLIRKLDLIPQAPPAAAAATTAAAAAGRQNMTENAPRRLDLTANVTAAAASSQRVPPRAGTGSPEAAAEPSSDRSDGGVVGGAKGACWECSTPVAPPPLAAAPAAGHAKVLTPRDLVQHVPEDILAAALLPLRLVQLRPAEQAVAIRCVVEGLRGSNQSVADINGLALPAMLEMQSCRAAGAPPRCSMYAQLREAMADGGGASAAGGGGSGGKAAPHDFVRQSFYGLRRPEGMRADEPEDFLRLAAVYQAGASVGRGYLSTLKQLTNYTWMARTEAEACTARLRAAVADHLSAEFERVLEFRVPARGRCPEVTVQGQADIITPTAVWEVKCVSELTEEHFLQLGIYAWLWERSHGGGGGSGSGGGDSSPLAGGDARAFRIINVLTNEVWELEPVGLEEMMQQLLQHAFRDQRRVSNLDFIRRADQLALPPAKRRRGPDGGEAPPDSRAAGPAVAQPAAGENMRPCFSGVGATTIAS